MPVAVAGSGVEIVDADGRRYLDASGGAAVSCLGHGHPDAIAALHRHLDALAYARTVAKASQKEQTGPPKAAPALRKRYRASPARFGPG